MGLPIFHRPMPMAEQPNPTLWLWNSKLQKWAATRVNQEQSADVMVMRDKPETPNLPAVWVEKLPVPFTAPVKRRFRVERCPSDPSNDIDIVDDFPWYVEEITYGDDRDDHGRMPTREAAMALVAMMMKGDRYGAE